MAQTDTHRPVALSPAAWTRPHPAQRRRRTVAFGLVAAILAIMAFGALKALAPVAIPVIFAVFVTLAILPLDRALASRLPRRMAWLGRTGVLLLLLAGLSLFLGGLAFSVAEIATNVPAVPDEMDDILPSAPSDGQLGTVLAQLRDAIGAQAASLADQAVSMATTLAQGILGAMGGAFAGLVLVVFLILLALSEAPSWEGKLDTLAAGGPAAGGSWRDVTQSLGRALRRFFATRAVVGVISTVAYTLWLLPFGLDLLLVWAILVFLMNFIPNIGAFISGVFPTVYAFLTLDLGTALLIGAGLVVIEQVMGNWIDPRLQGNRIALSPLVILVAVVFWAWVWGVAGAFLGTPMTLAIMILCNAVTPPRPVALLLSNRTTHAELDAALGA